MTVIKSVISEWGVYCYECGSLTYILPTIISSEDVYFTGTMCSERCEKSFKNRWEIK